MPRSSFRSLTPALALFVLATAPADGQQRARMQAPAPERTELRAGVDSVALGRFGPRPVVDVLVNGRGPYPFILDTGAGGTVLHDSLAIELDLPVLGEARVRDPIRAEGLPATMVRMDSIAVGNAVFHGVSGVAMEWSRFAGEANMPRGVLGTRIFAELLLTFDLPADRVVLERGELGPVDSVAILPLGLSAAGIPTVTLTIAGREFEAHLDTGAPGGITLPGRYATELPLASAPVEIGRGRTIASDLVVLGAPLVGTVRLGGHAFANPELRFSDQIPHVNIGAGFLNSFRVTFDRRNMRVRFMRGAAGE